MNDNAEMGEQTTPFAATAGFGLVSSTSPQWSNIEVLTKGIVEYCGSYCQSTFLSARDVILALHAAEQVIRAKQMDKSVL